MSGEHAKEAVAEIISLNVRYIKYLTLREICNTFWMFRSSNGQAVEELTDQIMNGEIDIENFKSKINLLKGGSEILPEDLWTRRLESLFRILEREDL